MEIICLRENILKAINQVEKIIGKNFTLPILNNIYLKTEKGRLKIIATNLETAIISWVQGKIIKEGEITVPAKIISNIISELNDEKINIELKNNILNIKTANYKAKINGIDSKDFPLVPKIKNEKTLKIKQKNLKNYLLKVIKAAAGENSIRSVISGILLNFTKKGLRFVATDSFRLAHGFDKNQKYEDEISFILPSKTALELIRLSSDENSDVEVKIDDSQVLFSFPQTDLISRLVEGNFPDYEKIIPNNFETKITLDKNEFLKNIKLVSLFSPKLGEIKIIPLKNESSIKIVAEENNLGENNSIIKANIQGKEEETVFNYRYLLDGVENIEGKELILSLNGSGGPAHLSSSENNDYFYLLMPIKNQ